MRKGSLLPAYAAAYNLCAANSVTRSKGASSITLACVVSFRVDCIRPILQDTVGPPSAPKQIYSDVRPPTLSTPLPYTVDRVGEFHPISPRIIDTFSVAEQAPYRNYCRPGLIPNPLIVL